MNILPYPVQLETISSKPRTPQPSNVSDAKGEEKDIELARACSELESLFIYQLLKEMRASVPKSGFTGGEMAADFHTSLTDFQLAAELAENGGIGLAKVLADRLGRYESCKP